MELIEYKRHLVNGVLVDPEWVHIGTIFGGSTEHTWIGIVLSEADRAYYIPDTVETKTVEHITSELSKIIRDIELEDWVKDVLILKREAFKNAVVDDYWIKLR